MPKGDRLRKRRFNQYVLHSKQQRLYFDLSEAQVFALLDQRCSICGAEPTSIYSEYSYRKIDINGISRINYTRSFTSDNVRPCCFECADNVSPNSNTWIKRLLYQYRLNAKNHDRDFTLTDDEAFALLTGNCFYCGAAPSIRAKKSKYSVTPSNGIDRVNSKLGYIPGNVVTCCFPCNQLKGAKSQDLLFERVKAIYEHLQLSNN